MCEDFETRANEAYGKFAPIAKRYYYTFVRPSVTLKGLPVALFVGNHSSGKSTLINWIVGGDPIQDTGVAPTDDGFTILAYGEQEEDVVGPAALARLPGEFLSLDAFGDSFKHRLKLKIRNRVSLKDKILIDSPGMIDSAEGTVTRDYDFNGVIKCFAKFSDTVFFLLDPEKPGTTGETVTVFSKCLTGMEYKLYVLLNKCDAISSVNDFARVYGTTCWNLARILHTKDLPKIWTIYSGPEKESTSAGMSFLDFNRQRKELCSMLSTMDARRNDNIFASVCADFEGLSMRMNVVNHVMSRIRRTALSTVAYTLLTGLALGFALYWYLIARSWSTVFAASLGIFLALFAIAGATYLLLGPLTRFVRNRSVDELDAIYEDLYRKRVTIRRHDDLTQCWENIKAETADTIRRADLDLPWFAESIRKRLDRTIERLRA